MTERRIVSNLPEILGADPSMLEGLTIAKAEAFGSMPALDRAYSLRLTFTDGTVAKVGFWAAYADDSSLELGIDPPNEDRTPVSEVDRKGLQKPSSETPSNPEDSA